VDRLYPLQTNQTSGAGINSATSLQNPNPFWPQSFDTSQSMDGINMSMVNDASTIDFRQGSIGSATLPNQDMNWVTTPLEMNSNVPIVNDDAMNWATFDDLVQQYAVQNELHMDGANTIPGFYGTGSSLF
jgi:hypothetical protein